MDDFLQVDGVEVESLRTLHTNAKEFFNRAPWKRGRSNHVVKLQALGQTRILQLLGASGTTFGLSLWKSYEEFQQILDPSIGSMAIMTHKPLTVEFKRYKQAQKKSIEFVEKHSLDVEPNGYPEIMALGSSPTMMDLKLLEVAFAGLPEFYLKFMKRDGPYRFKPVSKTHSFKLGCMEGVKHSAKFIYPAGDIDPVNFALGRVPGYVQMHCPPPSHVKTAKQAIQYYNLKSGPITVPSDLQLNSLSTKHVKLILQGCGVKIPKGCNTRELLIEEGKRQHKAEMDREFSLEEIACLYGLAFACWKGMDVPMAKQAIRWANMAMGKDFSDPFEIRLFLLDVLMENGMHDETLGMMNAYRCEACCEFFWSSALIMFAQHGPNHKESLAALKDAIEDCPYVLPYIIGKKEVPSFAGTGRVNFLPPGERDAVRYVNNHLRHWVVQEGAALWVLDRGYDYVPDDLDLEATHEESDDEDALHINCTIM